MSDGQDYCNPGPWFIWESNRREATALRVRLHNACRDFQGVADENIFKNKNLWRTVTGPAGSGLVFSFRKPNQEAMLGAFCNLCRWFLGEVSEAWIEHIVQRVGMKGDAAIQEFAERSREFTAQAFENNWKWGLRFLQLQQDDDMYHDLAKTVASDKLAELHSLWPDKPAPLMSAGVKRTRPKRLPATVESPIAARRMELFLTTNGIGQTDFASTVGTTDRTLRSFRVTGKIKRDTLEAIAKHMKTTKEELLKPE